MTTLCADGTSVASRRSWPRPRRPRSPSGRRARVAGGSRSSWSSSRSLFAVLGASLVPVPYVDAAARLDPARSPSRCSSRERPSYPPEQSIAYTTVERRPGHAARGAGRLARRRRRRPAGGGGPRRPLRRREPSVQRAADGHLEAGRHRRRARAPRARRRHPHHRHRRAAQVADGPPAEDVLELDDVIVAVDGAAGRRARRDRRAPAGRAAPAPSTPLTVERPPAAPTHASTSRSRRSPRPTTRSGRSSASPPRTASSAPTSRSTSPSTRAPSAVRRPGSPSRSRSSTCSPRASSPAATGSPSPAR